MRAAREVDRVSIRPHEKRTPAGHEVTLVLPLSIWKLPPMISMSPQTVTLEPWTVRLL